MVNVDHKPESTNSPIHLSFLNLSKSLSKLSTLVAIALSWGHKVQRLLMGYANNILNQVYQMAPISVFWESKTRLLSPLRVFFSPHTHLNHFLFSTTDNERLYWVCWTACLESVKRATCFWVGTHFQKSEVRKGCVSLEATGHVLQFAQKGSIKICLNPGKGTVDQYGKGSIARLEQKTPSCVSRNGKNRHIPDLSCL